MSIRALSITYMYLNQNVLFHIWQRHFPNDIRHAAEMLFVSFWHEKK